MKKLLLAALLVSGAFIAPANAQNQPQALIVATCGTPPVSYVAGTYGILTMDTTGKICDSGGGGGGGGTQNVNITQILGAAPSATNPLWVSPATGAIFPSALNATPTVANGNGVVPAPSSESAAALSPVPSTSLEANHVIKAGAGNLYSFNVSADSTLSAAAWWLMIYNATSAPADGAVAPVKCYAFPSGTTGYSAAFTLPVSFSTGITLGVSTTGCFTKTASAHAFISGDAK